MHRNRPINLNLFTIRFPIPAIVSILHRISGVALLVFIPLALLVWDFSLTSAGFDSIKLNLTMPLAKVLVWLLLIPLWFHLVAGIRHLLMDIHLGESLNGGRLSALLTFIFTIFLMVISGIWIW